MRRTLGFLSACGAALCWSVPARADNDVAANAHFLMHGEKRSATLDAGTTARWYQTNLVAGRSYAAYCWVPRAELGSVEPVLDEVSFFTDAGTTAATVIYAEDHEVDIDIPPSITFAQTKIIPTTTGTHWLRVSTSSAPAAAYEVNLILVETTLFSPWWFVDEAFGYEAFLHFRNNTSSNVTVVVTAFTGTGAEAAPAQTFVIAGNAAGALAVGDTLGAADGFGSAQIAHSGPPGAVAANLTTLSAITGISYDIAFQPRMQWGVLGSY